MRPEHKLKIQWGLLPITSQLIFMQLIVTFNKKKNKISRATVKPDVIWESSEEWDT